MVYISNRRVLMVGTLLMFVVLGAAQTAQPGETLSIEGYPGQAKVMRSQGRVFVDVENLARVTNGSLRFEGNTIILSLPSGSASTSDNEPSNPGFSRPFMNSAIEAMASIREWGGMLKVIVENGYPVGKAMSGNTIRAYQGRAADHVALASAAASTDDDHRGLELLRDEFNNLQEWSESFIDARNSLSTADLSTSENPLKNDENAQKIIQCGQFLQQMFASGAFQDDVACQ
jgi:hypothetical protein